MERGRYKALIDRSAEGGAGCTGGGADD